MELTGRRRTRVALALLVAVAVLAALDAAWLARQVRWNDAIARAELPAEPDDALPVEVRFGQAYAQAAAGAGDAALKSYRGLQSEPSVAQAARFNSANVLMRQASALRATPQPGQAIPLIELAKQTYREILRADPGHWDARYNLERAQRLLPDPEENEAPPAVPRNAERAATTMRGYSAGLP